MSIQYRNIKCCEMNDKEISDTSKLFSEHYGNWSINEPTGKGGKPIKFPKRLILERFASKPDCYVALAYKDNQLVGHIFYIRRKGSNFGIITWILQLVVSRAYRGQNIGSKMMQSIWGLSDSYACGLYTSNPMTIRALEKATMRQVNEKLIRKHLDKLKSVAGDLFPNMDWIDSYHNGMVNTSFFTDHRLLADNIKKAYPHNNFPLDSNLQEGYEWLAFTFRSQPPMISHTSDLNQYLEFSEDILKQAYSKMNDKIQPWAAHTLEEIDFLERYIPEKSFVLDLGCGIGRHSLELAKRNHSVVGVDFSKARIEQAKSVKVQNTFGKVSFYCADVRTFKYEEKADVVLCLYDVVGSFPDEHDNLRILQNAYRRLKPGGTLILSVMNMALTKKRCKNNIVNGIEKNLDRFLRLQGSNTMQTTGNIFNGKYILIDEDTGIVYRKEQFFANDSLPIEHIIRDRRYTAEGIQRLIYKAGFLPLETYYVQAGRFDHPLPSTSSKAKEILVVAKKANRIRALLNSKICLGKTW